MGKYYNTKAFINMRDFDSIESCLEFSYSIPYDKLEEMTSEPIMTNEQYEKYINFEGSSTDKEIRACVHTFVEEFNLQCNFY